MEKQNLNLIEVTNIDIQECLNFKKQIVFKDEIWEMVLKEDICIKAGCHIPSVFDDSSRHYHDLSTDENKYDYTLFKGDTLYFTPSRINRSEFGDYDYMFKRKQDDDMCIFSFVKGSLFFPIAFINSTL